MIQKVLVTRNKMDHKRNKMETKRKEALILAVVNLGRFGSPRHGVKIKLRLVVKP